jgi:hypothetical protein
MSKTNEFSDNDFRSDLGFGQDRHRELLKLNMHKFSTGNLSGARSAGKTLRIVGNLYVENR